MRQQWFLRWVMLCMMVAQRGVVALGNEEAETSRELADHRAASVARFEQAFDELGWGQTEMLAGVASSMEKILPRDTAFRLSVTKAIRLSVARNETESFQIAVMPRATTLEQVVVSVGGKIGVRASLAISVDERRIGAGRPAERHTQQFRSFSAVTSLEAIRCCCEELAV